jgi:adenylate cyclase
MGLEIERKFLLKNDNWTKLANKSKIIKQGYLSTEVERTVRVRISDTQAYITIKGKNTGASRAEFEYPIPIEDAYELLSLCQKPLIEKIRYVIPYHDLLWEIDIFEGDNAGLKMAEVELADEDQTITFPDWIGKEVTTDSRYYNSILSTNPFKNWKTNE